MYGLRSLIWEDRFRRTAVRLPPDKRDHEPLRRRRGDQYIIDALHIRVAGWRLHAINCHPCQATVGSFLWTSLACIVLCR